MLVGEISWNNTTHVLKVMGTIYIDGDMRFDDNGQIVHYQGRAIIYASDDIEFDERVCAGGSGTTNCAASAATMSAWNPSTDLLTILAGNKDTNQPVLENGPPVVYQQNAEFDHSTQGSNSSQGDDPAQPGAFQGIVYAKGNCQVHEFFKLSGPVICNQIQINDGIESGTSRRSRRSRRSARSSTARSISIRTTPATFSMTLRPADGLGEAQQPHVVLARRNRARSRARVRELPERRRGPRAAEALDRVAGIGLHELRNGARVVRQRARGLVPPAARALPRLRDVDRRGLPGRRAAGGAARRRLLPRLRLQRRRVRRVLLLPHARHRLGNGSLAPDRAERGRPAGGGDRARCADRAPPERRSGRSAPSAHPSFSSWRRLPTPRGWAWAT